MPGGRRPLRLRQRDFRAQRAGRAGRRQPLPRHPQPPAEAPHADPDRGGHRSGPEQDGHSARASYEQEVRRATSEGAEDVRRQDRAELRKRKDVDPQRDGHEVAMALQDGHGADGSQERAGPAEARPRDQQHRDRNQQTEISRVQDQYKMWAVMLPPIPPLVRGAGACSSTAAPRSTKASPDPAAVREVDESRPVIKPRRAMVDATVSSMTRNPQIPEIPFEELRVRRTDS